MSLYSMVTDLLRQVANVLQPAHGGTGSTYGEQRTVIKAFNTTGADLDLYTLVEFTFAANSGRVRAVAAKDSPTVLGSVVGYYDGTELVEDDAPDGYEVAVQIAGLARVLIEDAVTRGEYAFAAATDGTMYSNAATGPGAFGLIIDSQDISTGATYASVQLLGARGGGGGTTVISTDYTYIVKQTTESVASSTVLQDDDELQFVGVSGAQYEWDMTLIIDHPGGNNSTDFKFEIGEDGTFRGFWHLIVAATGDIVQGSVQTGLTAHVINSATSPFIWRFIGGYGAAAGGTFRLRWCQNVGNANDLRVVAGSTLRYRRIA